MRILVWHGWTLEGSGSNVFTARLCATWRAAGHDVLLVCQEAHPERYDWIDAHGMVDAGGPTDLTERSGVDGRGRCVMLRPRIGSTLPVYVVDRYEGYADVRTFVDLTDEQLEAYLHANANALGAAVAWHGSEAILLGHAIPGAVIGRRALGAGRYLAMVHGSDLEYTVRQQDRYLELAREGLGAARAVLGPSAEVLERCARLIPVMRSRGVVVPPGVDVATFRPRPRAEALLDAASRLADDPDTTRGRPSALDDRVERALADRDGDALDAIAGTYSQDAPDPDAASRLRGLADSEAPIVGYLGKLIPQKGADVAMAACSLLQRDAEVLMVGFGSGRDRVEALAMALRRGDRDAVAWLMGTREMPIREGVLPRGVTFTGRLDHRYAPQALAAMDVLVVPSVMSEAFGMVAAEGAAAGALPIVARHSGLAEVAHALEGEVGRPGLFSFEPGESAIDRLAAGIERLLALDPRERAELGLGVSAFVGREWTWERTASRILAAATAPRAPGRVRGGSARHPSR